MASPHTFSCLLLHSWSFSEMVTSLWIHTNTNNTKSSFKSQSILIQKLRNVESTNKSDHIMKHYNKINWQKVNIYSFTVYVDVRLYCPTSLWLYAVTNKTCRDKKSSSWTVWSPHVHNICIFLVDDFMLLNLLVLRSFLTRDIVLIVFLSKHFWLFYTLCLLHALIKENMHRCTIAF